MSGDPSQRGSGRQRYLQVDEFVRSILDDSVPAADISPSGELYRVIERARRGPLATVPAGGANMPSDPSRDLQRRFSREPRNGSSQTLPGISSLSTSSNQPLPPLRSLYRRAPHMPPTAPSPGPARGSHRYRPSDRFADRYRFGADQRTVEDLEHNLENANSHLRALLDLNSDPSMPPLSPPLMSPPAVHGHDHAEEGRRNKRRKLDSERLPPSFKGFRYGTYGQVVPGELTMEIVCCDGGTYRQASEHAAENILKDDASVYCTKGNRCNIVLQHQGATSFSLKELIIKAPGRNRFSSPVREGMVFISMNKDDLLMRTAQYQIQYGYAVTAGLPTFEIEGSRPLAPILSVRHNEDGTISARTSARQRRLYNQGAGDDDDDSGRAQIPSEFTVAPPPFRVTTECSDEENDEEADHHFTRFRRRTPPNRIGTLPFESDSGEEWGYVEDPVFEGVMRPVRRGIPRNYALSDIPQTLSLAEAMEMSQLATQEALRAVGDELMAPHAKFYIDKDKNKCTIRFDPPVSARFILLKMWNPHNDPAGNIDIQGIIAKGFAGPRYFPDVELR